MSRTNHKQELFTEDMAKNIFVFDQGQHQPYVRKGGKMIKGSMSKTYHITTKHNRHNHRTYGSSLRYN